MSKSSKEISLSIINTYKSFYSEDNKEETDKKEENINNNLQIVKNDYFAMKNNNPQIKANQNHKEETTNNEDIFTNELLEQLQKEIFNENDEDLNQNSNTQENDPKLQIISPLELPPLIPKTKKQPKKICINFNNINQSISFFSKDKKLIQQKLEIYIYFITRQAKFSLIDYNIQTQLIESLKKNNPSIIESFFSGPFLIGSFKRQLNHPESSIDILFTCKNLKQLCYNKEYVIKSLIASTFANCFHIEPGDIKLKNNKKFTKFEAIIEINFSNVKVKMLIIDISIGENQKVINNIILNNITSFGEIEDSKEKVILCKLLRMWRRKWELNFLLPEILDEIANSTFYKSVSNSFLKIIYLLHSQKILSQNDIELNTPPYIEQTIRTILQNEKKLQRLQKACIKTAININNSLFKECFE